MAETYNHGVRVIEGRVGARTLRTLATAIIGLVASGPAADPAVFPANTPVAITNLDAAIVAAGATGTLKSSLQAIANQANSIVVVYRAVAGVAPATLDEDVVAGVR